MDTDSQCEPREGSLNWPQGDYLLNHAADPARHEDNVVMSLPGRGRRPPAVLAAIRQLVARHEGLRTTVRHNGDSTGRQRVWPSPLVDEDLDAVVCWESGGNAPEGFTAIANSAFDLGNEWPIKFLLVTELGKVATIGLVVDHFALDGWGARVVRRDLLKLLDAGVGGLEDKPTIQPLDIAAWESSAQGSRHLERSLRFWERQFARLGELAETHRDQGIGDENAFFHSCTLTSRSLLDAATGLSRAHRVPVSTVLLTAYARALCTIFETVSIGVTMLVANRNTSRHMNSASNLMMRAPLVFERPLLQGFDTSASAIYRQQLYGYEFAHVSRRHVDEIQAKTLPEARDLRRLGAGFNFMDLLIHSESEQTPEILGVPNKIVDTADEQVQHHPPRRSNANLMLHVIQKRHTMWLHLAWRAGLLPVQAEEVLRLISHDVHVATNPRLDVPKRP